MNGVNIDKKSDIETSSIILTPLSNIFSVILESLIKDIFGSCPDN
jgi:hypothetical protein